MAYAATETSDLLLDLAIRQRRRLAVVAAELGLSASQLHLLHVLDSRRQLLMRAVADALACDPSNVTGLVRGLERRDLIERRQDSDDRRMKIVSLTRKGAAMSGRVRRRFAIVEPSLRELTPLQRQELGKVLRQLLGV
jgi:DNA-binding MarR family transcriptional regulator